MRSRPTQFVLIQFPGSIAEPDTIRFNSSFDVYGRVIVNQWVGGESVGRWGVGSGDATGRPQYECLESIFGPSLPPLQGHYCILRRALAEPRSSPPAERVTSSVGALRHGSGD